MVNFEHLWKNIKIDYNRTWRKTYLINFLNLLVKRVSDNKELVNFLDQLKKISFHYATYSGVTISPFELSFFPNKKFEEIKKYSIWNICEKWKFFFKNIKERIKKQNFYI